MEKHFITAQQLLDDSWHLAAQVLASGFQPDVLVGIWRGGTPIAIAVQEYMAYKGIDTDHGVIQTKSYRGIGDQSGVIAISLLDQLIERLKPGDKLLLVDDVFDSGRTLQAVVNKLHENCRVDGSADSSVEIKTACPWYKPGNSKVSLKPDYYMHTTEKWLVFPHELAGLCEQEIAESRPEMADLISRRY